MPPAHLRIRPFEPRDQSVARQLINQGLGDHFGYVDESYNPDLADIAVHYLACGDVFVVAELDGELVGTGALVREDVHIGRLVRMSVAPACRRRGIARALVAHLIAIAHERDDTRLVLETNCGWDDAIGLYRACGFVEFMPPDAADHPGLIHLTLDLTTS
jgi:ribosomal protein S18 acetylase RimI-like enzyme